MTQKQIDTDILIVGGGPVGLMLANLLGQAGIRTIVLEQRTQPPAHSMAIGVTPPSIEILESLNLADIFVRSGVPVRRARVFENQTQTGQLDFDNIPSDYRFFLSIPQSETQAILLDGLARWDSVTHRSGIEFAELRQAEQSVTVEARDTVRNEACTFHAQYVIGCDGHRSAVREQGGFTKREQAYRQRWVMGDFPDAGHLGTEAHLYFSAEGSTESFPLPAGKRRWIAQVNPGDKTEPETILRASVEQLAGVPLGRAACTFVGTFGAKRMLAKRYHNHRVLLCGDAAHVMSSIGGQGMNTGFADAELLAKALGQALRNFTEAGQWFAHYEQTRRKSFSVAANRAACGMWLGTLRGQFSSRLRGSFIRHVLFSPWMEHRLAPHFTMLTIPNRNLANSSQPSLRLQPT
jgi:2-polyprenyl-6-methoxyphenol hydroxylase-like FAD-dependent oxidoreductase